MPTAGTPHARAKIIRQKKCALTLSMGLMALQFAIANTIDPCAPSIPNMQRILKSENLEFDKQDLKRRMKCHGVKDIEKKIRLYQNFHISYF